MQNPFFILVLLSLLSACQTTPRTELERVLSQRDLTPDYPKPDHTYLSFTESHGYQIEYLAKDGNIYLWYPRNTRVVSGRWKLLLNEMCFLYGSNTFNPSTLTKGGKWVCRYREQFSKTNVGVLLGDPFKLSAGSLPYIRNRCDPTKAFRLLRKNQCD